MSEAPPVFAAAVIIEHGGGVVIVKRGREPRAGFWSLPGGRIEPGETPEGCALREAREETGLSARLTGVVGYYPPSVEPQGPAAIIVFRGEAVGGELRRGPEEIEIATVPWEQLGELEFAFLQHVRAIEDAMTVRGQRPNPVKNHEVRVLGVDYGTKRLGLAISSPDGTYALPLRAVELPNPNRAVAEVMKAIEEEGATAVAVGRPTHDGPGVPITAAVDLFVEALRERAAVPVHTVDEAFTSARAESILSGAKGRTEAVDATAAVLILEEFLTSTGRRDVA